MKTSQIVWYYVGNEISLFLGQTRKYNISHDLAKRYECNQAETESATKSEIHNQKYEHMHQALLQ